MAVYVITDERDDPGSLLRACEAAIRGGADVIQLRRKHDSGRALIELGRRIRDLTSSYHALYIVNDRVDVAIATDADGVHIGQDDMPLSDAHRLLGQKIIGVSAATVEDARQAIIDGADYLGIGAIFATPSKAGADIAGLREISDVVHGCPLVAIGGIGEANANMVLSAGADGLAVVSAVMSARNPEEATRRLRNRVAGLRRR